MDEQKLIERLRLIEALFAGASTAGERVAAGRARERILERLRLTEKEEPLVEYHFSMPDLYSRRVFVALCRRYDLQPYRYKRQRYTTVMLRVTRRFVNETLWPEYEKLSETLQSYLGEVTDRVVAEVIHEDHSEATVVEEGGQLPSPAAPSPPSAPSRASSSPTSSSPSPVTARTGATSTPPPSASSPDDKPAADASSRRETRRDKKRKKKRRHR